MKYSIYKLYISIMCICFNSDGPLDNYEGRIKWKIVNGYENIFV